MNKNDFILDRANNELDTMVNQEAINKFLTEKFLGKCWHEPDFTGSGYASSTCCDCNEEVDNQDLFTPTGFFILWEKAQKEEWWFTFLETTKYHQVTQGIRTRVEKTDWLGKALVNPLTFPILLAEYIGWKEEL